MNHERVLAGAAPHAFESACLIQCADTSRLPGRRRPEWRDALVGAPAADPALAEFDQPDAAVRLATLLTGLGCTVDVERHSGGGRRRFHVHRVVMPELQQSAASLMMAAAWRQGRLALLRNETLGSSARANARRATLAQAAWRAALLAAGRRRRAGLLGVRLGDPEMAAVLVRAARLMGVTAQMTSRPGCLQVTVPADITLLLPPVTAVGASASRVECGQSHAFQSLINRPVAMHASSAQIADRHPAPARDMVLPPHR
ncbi:hypothetical protein [Krasilnikovia sp. M28-CT-15]|uniref:hypothetical protein n=1 Tax=Krasilnikovia sp. M28-CT-15 TaxID=3373540 RepID=UPI003876730B